MTSRQCLTKENSQWGEGAGRMDSYRPNAELKGERADQ